MPPEFRDLDAQRIVEAYERAKRRNPKLSQGEFMMRARPDAYRNRESAGRYFRLLKSGKRSGKNLYAEATGRRTRSGKSTLPPSQVDGFQAFVTDKNGNVRSFNLTAVGSRSAFDVPEIEERLRRNTAILDRKRNQWLSRYEGIEIDDDDFQRLTVRKVNSQRTRAEWLPRLPF